MIQGLRSCILSISVTLMLGALMVLMVACTPIQIEEAAAPSTQPEAIPAPLTITDFKLISVSIPTTVSETISESTIITVFGTVVDGSLIGLPLTATIPLPNVEIPIPTATPDSNPFPGPEFMSCRAACYPNDVFTTFPICICNYSPKP